MKNHWNTTYCHVIAGLLSGFCRVFKLGFYQLRTGLIVTLKAIFGKYYSFGNLHGNQPDYPPINQAISHLFPIKSSS